MPRMKSSLGQKLDTRHNTILVQQNLQLQYVGCYSRNINSGGSRDGMGFLHWPALRQALGYFDLTAEQSLRPRYTKRGCEGELKRS